MGQQIAALLIEEDHDTARRIHGALITLGGSTFEVVAAPTLASGLSQLRRRPVDVIFISLTMPAGLDAIKDVRAIDARPGIVALGGRETEHLALRAIGEGAQEFLVKGSFDRHDVVRAARFAYERRRAEIALLDGFNRERELVSSLQLMDDMKNTFLTAVSHELRAPLTAVIGYAHTLKRFDEIPEAARTEMVERLSGAATKLQRLLEELLDLDRLTKGNITPRRLPTDVARLAEQIVADIGADTHPIRIDAEQVVAAIDPQHAERILENLIRNALNHTPAGTQIWIRALSEQRGVTLVVEDAGPGVSDVDAKQIFEPFNRGSAEGGHVSGLGIGLSLVDRFARLHGGEAWVQERDGGGSSFRVFLAADVIAARLSEEP